MQGSIGIVGLIALISMCLFFPETSQPGARGIDRVKKEEGDRWRKRFILINPLRPLLLLRSPNLLLVVCAQHRLHNYCMIILSFLIVPCNFSIIDGSFWYVFMV